MAARPANKFATASPNGSPNSSPTKLKPTPPKMLTIQELGLQSTNFLVRVLVDNIAEPREFSNGRGCILRVQLSDSEGSSSVFNRLCFIASLQRVTHVLCSFDYRGSLQHGGQACRQDSQSRQGLIFGCFWEVAVLMFVFRPTSSQSA